MTIRKKMIGLLASFMVCASSLANEPARVVSLGGSVTEIVYALGAQNQLVGVDQSSIYPREARELPSVGYYRRLPAEGVASLKPTLVLASEHAGPPQVIEQLRELGMRVLLVPDNPTVPALRERVRVVAQALGKEQQADAVLTQFDQDLQQAIDMDGQPATAMLIVMRGGKLLGAGGHTNADTLMTMAGLQNTLAKQTSYQPLSAEVVSAIAPDVIIVTSSSVESLGGLDAFKQQPAVANTPAIKNGRVVVLDDLLAMGFGLRLPQAIVRIKTETSHGNSD